MPDPFDIPDQRIDAGREAEIVNHLTSEIQDDLDARRNLEMEWADIRRMFDLTELPEKKNFPFEGAAHLMVPLIATFTAHVVAKILNTIWTPQSPIAIASLNPQFHPFLRDIRAYINHLILEVMKLAEEMGPALLDFVLLGTGVTKTFFEDTDRILMEYDPTQEKHVGKPIKVHNGPRTISIPLNDYGFRAGTRKHEDSPHHWHRIRLTEAELRNRMLQGRYNKEAVMQILEAHKEPSDTEHEEEVLLRESAPYWTDDTNEYEIFEVWFQWSLKDNEPPAQLVWVVHKDANIALRKQYNWMPLGDTPFDLEVFEERPNRVYGAGVGKMTMSAQKEVSTMRNQSLDNRTLANTTMLLVQDDSLLPDNIPVKPGGSIRVGDTSTELVPFAIGRPFDSSVQDEQHVLSMVQQRVGIQEYFGDDGAAAGGTANAVLAVMAERTRRFDLVIRRVRRWVASIASKALLLEQKYGPKERAIAIMGEKGVPVAQLLSLPEGNLADGVTLTLTATTSTTSQEMERNNKLSLWGLSTQYHGQVSQFLLQAFTPGLPPTVAMALLQSVESLTTVYEDILQDYNLPQAEELGINLRQIQQTVAQAQSLAPGTPPDAGSPVPAGAPGPTGDAGQGGGQPPQGGGQPASPPQG